MRKKLFLVLAAVWTLVMVVFTVKREQSHISKDEHKQLLTEAKEISVKEAKEEGIYPLSDEDRFGYYASPIRVNNTTTVKLNVITRKESAKEAEQIEKVWISTSPKKIYNNEAKLRVIDTYVDKESVVVVGQYNISSCDGEACISNTINYSGKSLFD